VTRIKICGVTSESQARACADAGADAIGINFVASSPRCIDERTARGIVAAAGTQVLVVGVVADRTPAAMRALRDATGVGCLQLHGEESAEDVASMLPHAYKAMRIGGSVDVRRANTMPGEWLMVDAKVDGGALGGTGHVFDWMLVVELAKVRKVVLAGGLTPENVANAIRQVRPWCVDVASGVESAPGVKDMAKVRAFVNAVKGEE
jgi:phosphoribosylanthranilate isomerase